jgi:hypothetical protein
MRSGISSIHCSQTYGALRTRHYFHVIGYANALIDELRASGTPLLLPIEIYADKIRRSQFGVEHVPEVIERVAKAVSSRQQLFDVDSMPWRGPQLGGDAQLEALAFFSQLAVVQVGFGLPALQAMQRRLALHGGWQRRYRWVEQVTAAFDIDLFLENGPPGMRALDMPLVSPLLIASLMVRAYNQEPASPGEMEKLPAGRLARWACGFASSRVSHRPRRNRLMRFSSSPIPSHFIVAPAASRSREEAGDWCRRGRSRSTAGLLNCRDTRPPEADWAPWLLCDGCASILATE